MIETESLRIALACGGTGGHIFPGLATAEVLRDRGHEVHLWLAGKDVESEAVAGWPGPIHTVPSEGFMHGLSPRSLKTAWTLMGSARKCVDLMRGNPPDVLLAMGSYASVGPAYAAMRLRIPYVLHEANVLPGRAVRLFSRWATTVAGSFEETRYYLQGRPLVVTGMPMRRELAEAAARPRNGTHDAAHLTLLVMGGSRGARTLNQTVTRAVCECHGLGHKLKVIHLAGRNDEITVRAAYRTHGVPAEVLAFTKEMSAIYAAADLAICRSGASTCSELSAFGVPALLIPYPHAANDHQTANARAMEKSGAADVVPEKDLSVAWLKDYIAQCVLTPDRLSRMSAAMRRRGTAGQGTVALADLVENVVRRDVSPGELAVK